MRIPLNANPHLHRCHGKSPTPGTWSTNQWQNQRMFSGMTAVSTLFRQCTAVDAVKPGAISFVGGASWGALPTAGRVSGNSSGDGHHADDCAILRLVTLTAAQKSPSLQNIQLISKDDRCKRNTTFHFCGHKVNMLLLFRWTFHHQQLLEAHMEQLLPRLAIAPVPVSWFIAAVSPTQSWP